MNCNFKKIMLEVEICEKLLCDLFFHEFWLRIDTMYFVYLVAFIFPYGASSFITDERFTAEEAFYC